MHSNWWFSLLTCAELMALAAVVFLMVWKRQLAKWPSLFTALSIELLTDLCCMALMSRPGHYRAYFYTYWPSIALQAVIRLWVIGDVIRAFPGIDILSSRVYLFVGVAGATMASCAAYFCYHTSGAPAHGLQNMALLLNRCVNIAWATFLVAVLGSIKLFNLGWDRYAATISNGFFMRICAGLIVGELMSINSITMRIFANSLDSACSIAVFSFWICAISREQDCPEAHIQGDVPTLARTRSPA